MEKIKTLLATILNVTKTSISLPDGIIRIDGKHDVGVIDCAGNKALIMLFDGSKLTVTL